MADKSTPNSADTLDAALSRLSKKSGVQATLALDRATGAILKTGGNVQALRSMAATHQREESSSSSFALSSGSNTQSGSGGLSREDQGAKDVAAMVWNFVNAAGGLIQGLDADDEVKLLRLRTKKQELVIVPDTKYILVVVHDAAPA